MAAAWWNRWLGGRPAVQGRHVFVVSTGRSGTTSLAAAFAGLPGVRSVHEPDPVLLLEASAYRNREADKAAIRRVLQRTRSSREEGELYLESNQALSLLIPVVNEVFPDAGFVWLLRNGADFVPSAVQKQWYTGHSENHDRYEDCPPVERMWIDGRIQGDRCGAVRGDEWQGMSPFARCCWYWSYVNRRIEADLDALLTEERVRTLRLESLDDELPDLVAWLGIDTPPGFAIPYENRAKRPLVGMADWSEDERSVFERWCGEAMDRWYPDWRGGEQEDP